MDMTHIRLRPALSMAWLAAMVVLAAACGSLAEGGTDSTSPPATTAAPTTTEPPPTTAVPTTAVPTTAVPTTTTAPTTTAAPTTTTQPGNAAAPEGSGCTPGPGALPDGTWYGIVVSVSEEEFEFDLACYFLGDDARAAAAEDGAEDPPNDFYVRNVNETLRSVTIAGDTAVVWYPDFGDPSSEATTTYGDWIDLIEDRNFTPGVWVEIDGGVAGAINEQWAP